MNILKKLLKSRLFKIVFYGLLAAYALVWSAGVLTGKASQEARARKGQTALVFEAAPDKWLSQPADVRVFQQALADKSLSAVGLRGGLVLFTLKDGTRHSTRVPGCTQLSCAGTVLDGISERSLRDKFALTDVDIDPRTPTQRLIAGLMDSLAPLMSLLLLSLVGYMVYISTQGGLGDKKASRLAEKPKTRFTDVVGAEEAKAALKRVQAFVKDPAHYVAMGARPPRGILLEGPPGTGKTLLARALAGECGANFISVDGSYFTSMFYGMGVKKVRDLFEQARRAAPCVLFIDEVDGIGRRVSSKGASGGESEQNRIINRILVEMDGFLARENVVVIAATNHVENIDEAMRRPGRFDSVIRLTLPTVLERKRLFELYLKSVKTKGAIATEVLARMTQGMSPADIADVVNKAASLAAEQRAACVGPAQLLAAIETRQMGGDVSAVKGLLTPQTRERIAIHEAGHALVAHLLEVGSVDRVSIAPRGAALGVTYVSRNTEEPLYGQAELGGRLAMLLAGREAEMLVKGNVSSGAADDLKKASELAYSMVAELGFSRSFGPLSLTGVPSAMVGPDLQALVLEEARSYLQEAQHLCAQLLSGHRGALDAVTALLLEHETVGGESLEAALNAVGPRESAVSSDDALRIAQF